MTDITTNIILLAAVAILGWGFYRARPLGKLGLLAWLQSVVLMTPWLLLFGLMSLGVAINLASILFLLVGSVLVYIALGRQLRAQASKMPPPPVTRPASDPAIDRGDRPETEHLSAKGDGADAATSAEDGPHPIPAEDLKQLQGIFSIDTFFATEVIPYQDGVIFKGNLRSDPEAAWDMLNQKLAAALDDRYRLFLVQNQEARPVVIVLPSRNDPQPLAWPQKLLAVSLLLGTFVTCCTTVGFLLEFDLFQNGSRLSEVLPMAFGLLSVLVVHEIGHQVMAYRHGVKFSWPFFLPALQIGSFGALNRFESLIPSRKVLFDVAFAGPAAGGIYSLLVLLVGFVITTPESLFKISPLFFQGSILVGTLARTVLGESLQAELIAVHPLVIVGWVGLVITALNLMPAGQLDGGRMVQAVYGRKVAGRTTFVTLIFLGIASLVNPLALYWAAIILILQRDLERPSLNELSEPDDARAALALVALFLMIAILMPLTPSLAGRLGIGV